MKSDQTTHPTTGPGRISAPENDLVLTPGGWRPRNKVHHIEEGHHVTAADGKLKKVHSKSGKVVQELDDVKETSNIKPNMPENVYVPDEKKVKIGSDKKTIPTYGSGWVCYAYWNNIGNPINSFKTSWIVPPYPTTHNGQTIFLFNGMQNSAYILQPVLQFGTSAAGGGDYWSIANWYADGQGGSALHSSLIQVYPGDNLQGIMSLIGQSAGLYSYTSSFAGHSSINLEVDNIAQLTFACETLEVYGITTCSDYPATSKTAMTGIEILVNGAEATLSWTADNAVTDCNQQCVVVSNASPGGEVDLYFDTSLANSRTILSNNFSNVFLRMDGRGVTGYVAAGSGLVNCQYGAQTFEQFVITLQTDGSYTIQSAQFPNVFLRMDGAGVTTVGGKVNCQYTPPGAYEKFQIVKQADGTYYIASTAFATTYLRMDGTGVTSFLPSGGGTVNCARSVGAWEKFIIVPALY